MPTCSTHRHRHTHTDTRAQAHTHTHTHARTHTHTHTHSTQTAHIMLFFVVAIFEADNPDHCDCSLLKEMLVRYGWFVFLLLFFVVLCVAGRMPCERCCFDQFATLNALTFAMQCRSHLQDMKDVTNEVHYEGFRRQMVWAVCWFYATTPFSSLCSLMQTHPLTLKLKRCAR